MSVPVLRFLDDNDVLEIHAAQLAVFGGASGLRERALLESAVAQPRASFAGTYMHEDLLAMGSAYLFHIARNHPFVDGNKRTAMLSAVVFLDINGLGFERPSFALYELAMGVAGTQMTKAEASHALLQIARAEHA